MSQHSEEQTNTSTFITKLCTMKSEELRFLNFPKLVFVLIQERKSVHKIITPIHSFFLS